MKKYSQFVFESHFKDAGHNPDLPHGGYTHEHDVGHSKVTVHYHHEPQGGHGHYKTDFFVNDSPNHHDNHDSPRHNQKILHHVHKSVHAFIHEKKPKALHFEADDGDEDRVMKKHHAYKKVAHHLAKHYGGTVDHHSHIHSVVKFDK